MRLYSKAACGGSLPICRLVWLSSFLLAAATASSGQGLPASQTSVSPLEAAFADFWSASTPEETAQAISSLLATDADFETLRQRLRQGRSYADDVPRGVVHGRNQTSDGAEHNYTFVVPERYDPARPTAVRFMLHGGVGTTVRDLGSRGPIHRLKSAPHITVLPSAWRQAAWWHASQLENLLAILDSLKRKYNVDENRVHLQGISDGGAGVYFMAMHHTTPWATYMPLIAHLKVLDQAPGRGGELYLTNLRNKPIFAVNTGRDPLYPHSRVAPYMTLLQEGGVDLLYHTPQDFGHNTNWWPQEREAIETFLAGHPRDPHPPRLSWTTSFDGDRAVVVGSNRAHWLVIEEPGSLPGQAEAGKLDELSSLEGSPIFSRRREPSRVDLERSDNAVEVRTWGVGSYTLLLSPHGFDLQRPITVKTNGVLSFEGVVGKDREVLLRWAAKDNDRTLLFAAELEIPPR